MPPILEHVVIKETAATGDKSYKMSIPPGFYDSIIIYSSSYPARYYQKAGIYDTQRKRYALRLESKTQKHLNDECVWKLTNITIKATHEIRVILQQQIFGDQIYVGVYASSGGRD